MGERMILKAWYYDDFGADIGLHQNHVPACQKSKS
jgi:hypothetical protein